LHQDIASCGREARSAAGRIAERASADLKRRHCRASTAIVYHLAGWRRCLLPTRADSNRSDLPDKANLSHSAFARLGRGSEMAKKLCAKTRSFCAFSTLPCVSSLVAKNILISFYQKIMLPMRIPPHVRGVRVVTIRRGGERWTCRCRQTYGRDADGEVVWSWRRDAGAKLARTHSRCAGDGGKRARSPGRSRIIRKTIARGMPGCLG
jgi:hypothetical protein